MDDLLNLIEGSQRITDIFGYWPSFHDAEIIDFHLWRGEVDSGRSSYVFPVLTLLVNLWELTNEVDAEGFLVCRHHTLAKLRFHHVDDLVMQGFNHQNAIFHLAIEHAVRPTGPSPHFSVHLEPAFGIDASFTCLRIEVIEARRCAEGEQFASL
jgi:hypothetical protein